jgi:hypothetical protein
MLREIRRTDSTHAQHTTNTLPDLGDKPSFKTKGSFLFGNWFLFAETWRKWHGGKVHGLPKKTSS